MSRYKRWRLGRRLHRLEREIKRWKLVPTCSEDPFQEVEQIRELLRN